MKKLIVIIGIVLISLFSFQVTVLAETFLKAEVDKVSISTDEDLTYKLVITSSEKRIPQPKLPAFGGFVVLSHAQTSQISISSGTQKTLVVYAFILAPAKAGKFRIEPSTIEIENKSYSSDAFKIEVKQGKARPQKKKTEQKPSLPQKPQPESEQSKMTL